ncbi:efflux RND transporter periplasmic adaptor subunit [Noviherbaspirillum sedimenti]|uniref:Efflux RND transporter periplasmic adaptor subunit n=2 Tax=Noviherbaspirillum sedimenti TaxID=2320865 RepID=A0A3A3G993_9BURK|nr:efflux RND transporter periplasmic adaptor subunit [Noviherbaspirillum sedimenti]
MTNSSAQAHSFAFARKRAIPWLLGLAIAAMLGACSRPVPKPEEIRPVRVVRLAAKPVDVIAEFPGEVKPRIESRLGFRVGGKIVARKVDVGATVKRGQVLMQLDPQDLQLAQMQANAALKAAESNHQLARAERARYQELREKNFVSQAVLDGKNTADQAARASYDQAVAAYRNQTNQAGYATLVADTDGVVTTIDAEVGQVVAAGSPVLRVAQMGEKEIVIGIPEDKVEVLRRISDVRVRIWARPDTAYAGKIREIAPMADPATRTYTARVALPDAPADVTLGMTAYVSFAAASAQPLLKLPLSALFQEKSVSAVWVVENGAVRLVPVQLAGPAGNEVLIAGGLAPGQTVVTAGVNLLKTGQKVKILGAEAPGHAVGTGVASAGEAAK